MWSWRKRRNKDLDWHIYLSLSTFSEQLLVDLCILVAVPPGVLQVLTRTLVAMGVQIDGAGCSLGQELHPDFLHSLCHILLGHSLQVLDRQPETAAPRREHVSKNHNQSIICPSIRLSKMETCLSSAVHSGPHPETAQQKQTSTSKEGEEEGMRGWGWVSKAVCSLFLSYRQVERPYIIPLQHIHLALLCCIRVRNEGICIHITAVLNLWKIQSLVEQS